MKPNSLMRLHFEGDGHSIDVTTLVNSLTHFQCLVASANLAEGRGGKSLALKVTAVRKGSFVLDFELAEPLIKTLFSSGSIAYAAGIVSIILGVVQVYRIFKGRPVTEDEVSMVRNEFNGCTVTQVVNVYNRRESREAVSRMFETVKGDQSVSGLDIESELHSVHFSREEFPDMVYSGFDSENPDHPDRTVDTDARLEIVSLAFEPASRWTFLYNGNRISTVVKDDALSKKIDEGERFGKGDAIRAKLRIVQRFRTDLGVYADYSFKVVEFYEHVCAAIPESLDLK